MEKTQHPEFLKRMEIGMDGSMRHVMPYASNGKKKRSKCDDSDTDPDEVEEERFEDEGGSIVEEHHKMKK